MDPIAPQKLPDSRRSSDFAESLPDLQRAAGIVGESPAIREAIDHVCRIARREATVLITGESGTGKELFARLIHLASSRHSRPFVAVNTAGLPEHLLESELFGHEKGAFTGAVQLRHGCFEQAHGGTLFLDEVADAPASTQARLLRVLQERTFNRVGGEREIRVDVRIVVATNRDLAAMVKKGRFREDLHYRINVIPLKLPPLRDRIGDVPLLLNHFFAAGTSSSGDEPPSSLSESAISVLASHPWPGNVRELRNLVERILVTAAEWEGTAEEVRRLLGAAEETSETTSPEGFPEVAHGRDDYRSFLHHREALARVRGNVTRASAILGIHRRTFERRRERWIEMGWWGGMSDRKPAEG